jgi:hypothetical protein
MRSREAGRFFSGKIPLSFSSSLTACCHAFSSLFPAIWIRTYTWNPKSRVAARLRDLTGVIYDGLSFEVKQAMFPERRQPRAKDKPVIG